MDKENVASPSAKAPGSVMEAYELVQKGLLKPKGVAELRVTKRKKKKQDKDKAKLLEAMGMSTKNEEEKRHGLDKRTLARVAFEKMQEKRQQKGSSRKHPGQGLRNKIFKQYQ
ncbi:protein FAM32A-like [Macaca thibetana thibetana]|uniref:protein FAM32A-like n=1 Tax=Macaca thibetana thibetana TaxID=257877 RepID=UPI0021BCB67F|nr:protein FAM32A-like [Macaca thibetana thibetana]